MDTLADLYERRDRLRAELDGLKDQYRANPDEGLMERLSNLKAGVVKVEREILDAAMQNSGQREDGSHTPGSATNAASRDRAPGGEAREAALRAIEARSDELGSAACDRLDDVIGRDKFGLDAEYVAAVSDPAYSRAFFKRVSGMDGAEGVLDPAETEALLRVGRAMSMRAMALGEGKTGGYGIPIQIDPTILLTSAGVTSALREKARVVTITTSEYKGITSAGPSAHFHKEGEEAADDSFEVAQPAIKAERADCFVPFSIEVGMDYVGFEAEIGRVMADAKNTLEGAKYTTGDGTDEPAGIVTGATETVETAEAGKAGIADFYKLAEALPPRFQEQASWLTALAVANSSYRLVGGGSTEPSLWNDARDRLLMKPWNELSAMDSKIETGKLIAIIGDIAAGFTIVDRIGMSVELIPHLFGTEKRPTGQRGLFAYWRTGSKVVNKSALRTLKVK